MTSPHEDGKTTAAKALFIGFLGAALGWAGVLIAAVAVATETNWSNGRPERDRSAQRRRSWLETQRAWLAADHGQRMDRAAAHRAWLASGADPATRPARRSKAARVAGVLRRVLAKAAVGAGDFGRGFRDGWQAANTRRRDGAGFREIVTGRTDPDTNTPVTDNTPDPTTGGDGDLPADTSRPEPGGTPTANPEPALEGELVTDTDTDQPNTPAPAGPAGESNAAVLARKLDTITTTVAGMSDDTDQLGTITGLLTARIRAAADLANTAGMPTQAVDAVNAAQHTAALISRHLDEFATGTTATSGQLTAAANGLRAVQNAEDRLRASGADGRAFETTAA